MELPVAQGTSQKDLESAILSLRVLSLRIDHRRALKLWALQPPPTPDSHSKIQVFSDPTLGKSYAMTYQQKGFWATQPLQQILAAEFLVCELGVAPRSGPFSLGAGGPAREPRRARNGILTGWLHVCIIYIYIYIYIYMGSVYISLSLYIYIYVYVYRERL